MKKFSLLLFFCLAVQLVVNGAEVIFPKAIVQDVDQEIILKSIPDSLSEVYGKINGKAFFCKVSNGNAAIPYRFEKAETIVIEFEGKRFERMVNPIPLWWSIIPPILAILLALFFREVISSLFIGLLIGCLIIYCYSDGLAGVLYGFMASIDKYLLNAMNDWGHLAVILFSTLIGGMVAVVSKNGGMQGVVQWLSKYASNGRSSQLVTWLLGILIFFDDYANTLIVGNTMRPLTDKYKVSREKLSYIVDSTAAPIAAIAFVTTWIGAELGYIQDGIEQVSGIDQSAYGVFLQSLQYAFYPILTIIFVFFVIWKSKDYGPMLKAEQASKKDQIGSNEETDQSEMEAFVPSKDIPYRWYNAALPVAVLIIGTIIGLFYTGWDSNIVNDPSISFLSKLSGIIGGADSYSALLWSSLISLIVAIALTVGQRIMKLEETIKTTMSGFKTMLNAIVILVLAWSLALITEDLHTASFLTGILSDNVSPYMIPGLTFVLSALVAFSTGSSWGTMAILYPLMLPTCWNLSMSNGIDPEIALNLFYNVVSTVLAGAVLGDHCSPISDTTILSSLASSCNHIQHVRTQLPYALSVGAVALLLGTIPASFGLPPVLLHISGAIVLYLLLNKLGKKSVISEPASE